MSDLRVKALARRHNGQWVVDHCPLCGRTHYHGATGGGPGDTLLGSRVPHCLNSSACHDIIGYDLVDRTDPPARGEVRPAFGKRRDMGRFWQEAADRDAPALIVTRKVRYSEVLVDALSCRRDFADGTVRALRRAADSAVEFNDRILRAEPPGSPVPRRPEWSAPTEQAMAVYDLLHEPAHLLAWRVADVLNS